MSGIGDSENKIELIKSQARRNNRTPREHCIVQIQKWRKRLEYFSTDFRALSDEEMQKAIDKEIQERKERDSE